MDNIIQMLIPLIVIILTFVLGSSRRRRKQRNAETERAENAMPEGNVASPPFMENFPFETPLEDMILQQNEVEDTPVVEEPEPVAVQEPVEPPQPPPVPVESPAGIRSVPATALLDLSPSTFRQGIILREILDRPRALRRGAPFRDRRDF
jgi:type IV secretory pathway VirB10-like protein